MALKRERYLKRILCEGVRGGHSLGMRQRRAEAWAKWRGLVAEQSGSGEGVAVFCRERGLPAWQFFAWKRRLREAEASHSGESAESVARDFVEVKLAAPGVAAAGGGAIELRLGRGRSLVVEPGFDTRHLRALLAVLEAEA